MGTTIHKSDNGLYSLNDLHKAAGGFEKDKPVHWLQLSQTKRYIKFLNEKSTVGIPTVEQNQSLITINGGDNRGTYAHKKLVYSYAMWIDCEFHDAVIEVFDYLVNDNYEMAKQIAQNIVKQEIKRREPNDVGTLAYLMGCSTVDSKYYYRELVSHGYVTIKRDKYGQGTYRFTERGLPYAAEEQLKQRTILFKGTVIELLNTICPDLVNMD